MFSWIPAIFIQISSTLSLDNVDLVFFFKTNDNVLLIRPSEQNFYVAFEGMEKQHNVV